MNPALMPVVPTTLAEHVEIVRERDRATASFRVCPQMHGTGLLTSFGALTGGGCVITLDAPSFEPVELWDVAAKHKAQQIAIVGDAFAKPMLRALDENPGRWDLSSLVMISLVRRDVEPARSSTGCSRTSRR